MKYLDYISRTVKRYMKKWRIRNESALKIRMIVIYTADIEPRQTQPVLDVGCLRLQVEEAFLCEMDWEETERELAKKIKEHEPLTAEDQMRFIVLPLTHKEMYALSDFLIMVLSWLVKQSLRAFSFQEVQP